MMHKGRKEKYVSAGVQKTPSMPFEVRDTVHLPDSEAGAAWYDPDQKPFYAETVAARKREPMVMTLNSALILLCALFVVFGALTLTRTVRKAALTKDISAMEQAIQRIQNSNAELILQVTEARDMARIGYAAVMNLDMVSADKAETIHVRALNTRPFGDTESSAFAGAKTGSRQSFQ